MADACRVCRWRPPRATKDLCATCYEYQRRTGSERSERLVVAHGRRLLEGKQR